MRASRLIAVVLFLGLIAAGCGFNPPSPPPTSSATCTQADGPSADTVAAEIAKLPAANWSEIVSGHTAECSLHWVVVSSGDASDSPRTGVVLRPQVADRHTDPGSPALHHHHGHGRWHRGSAVPMASGPRAGVLPYGHCHGPVQNRGRQAQGARSHPQPIATRRARCHRRSRTQRR